MGKGLLGWLKDENRAARMVEQPRTELGINALRESGRSVMERFRNDGEIARGGMASIRKVYDVELRRFVAMKVLNVPPGGDEEMYFRVFAEEAQITSQLDHPNICPVHEIGCDGSGTRFFTMKLVRGQTLTEIIQQADYSPADPAKLFFAIDIFRKVCDALRFAHSRGVIHRDLKPDNIMADTFGQVYLMDWWVALVAGFARTARTTPPTEERVSLDFSGVTGAAPGSVVGTLAYMSPEQMLGDDSVIDERTDVFGLGAILYEILTQRPPLMADSMQATLRLAQCATIDPPQNWAPAGRTLPAGLCRIAMRALRCDKNERYQNVAEMQAEIDAFLRGGWRFPSRRFSCGETIVVEGERGDRAFIIVEGTCRVFKLIGGQQVAMADLNSGDVFGETAVFAARPRTATVQAFTDVTVLEVTSEVFDDELGLGSWVGSFVRVLAERYIETESELRKLQAEKHPR